MSDIEIVIEDGGIVLEVGAGQLTAASAGEIAEMVERAETAAEQAETAQGEAESAADSAASDAGVAEAAADTAAAVVAPFTEALDEIDHVLDEFTTTHELGNTVLLTTGTALDSATKTLAVAYRYNGRITRVFNYNQQATTGTMSLKQVEVDLIGATGTIVREDDIAIPIGSAGSGAGILLADAIPVVAGQHPGFFNFATTGRTSYVLNGAKIVPHWSIAGNKAPADGAFALGTMVDTRAVMFGLEVVYDNGIVDVITGAQVNGRTVWWGKQGAVATTGAADTNFSGFKSLNEPFRHHAFLKGYDVAVEMTGVVSLAVWRRADDGHGWTFRGQFSKNCTTTGEHRIPVPADFEVLPDIDHTWIVGTTGSGKISRVTSTTDAQTWGVYSTIPFSAGVVGTVQSTPTTGDVAFEVRAELEVIDEVEPTGIMYANRFTSGSFPFEWYTSSTLHTVSVGKLVLGEEGLNRAAAGRRSQAFNQVRIRGRVRTPNLMNVFGVVPHADGYGSLIGIDVENDQLHFYNGVTGAGTPVLPSIHTTINEPFTVPMDEDTVLDIVGDRDDRVMLWRVMLADGSGEMASDGTAEAEAFDCSVVVDMTEWPAGDASFADHFNDIGQFCGRPFFAAPTGKGTGGELWEFDLSIRGGDQEAAITSDSMIQSRKDRDLGIGYAMVDHCAGGAVMIGRDGMNSSGARRLVRDCWWVTPRVKCLVLAQGMVDITGGTTAAAVYGHQKHTVDAMVDVGIKVAWASPAPTYDTDVNQAAQQDMAALIKAGAEAMDDEVVRYVPWNERFRTSLGGRQDEWFFGFPSVLTDAHWAHVGDKRALATLTAVAGDWIQIPSAAKFWN